jgi:acetyl esterase/lipase
MKNYGVYLITLFLSSAVATAQSVKPLPLYAKGIPNSKKAPSGYTEKLEGATMSMVTEPTLTPYFPAKGKANGTAIVICPGGGYVHLAMGHEGEAIAKKFNEIGVTAFVLKYRLPSDQIMVDKSIGPLQDAQRAIQLVREQAATWGINPNKVGIIGFSAGGHLASTAGTHFNRAVIDNPDQVNLRPDFMVLLYPVISFGASAHQGSRENLVGKDATQAGIDLYSNEKQVTAQTPPAFLVHAQDDKVVPVQNSMLFYEAMVKAGVKGELHIYEKGGHGFGLNNSTTHDQWFDRLVNWMKLEAWISQ